MINPPRNRAAGYPRVGRDVADPVAREKIKELVAKIGYIAEDNHIKKLIETIMNTEFHSAYLINNLKHVSMTFHSSKGLEYDQVIVFARDYSMDDEESVYNHYVAVTRGKNKLIIIFNDDANAYWDRHYWNNLEERFGNAGVELMEVMTIK